MKKRFVLSLVALSYLLGTSASVYAAKSKSFSCQEEAENYLTLHYNRACHYYNHEEWCNASNEFEKVIYFFPDSDTAAEASFYLAVCYFEMKEYDFANTEFSNYLKASNQPAFFEEAVYYKFCCAEHFKNGKRKRPFKMRYFPKWLSGQDLALTIYDEVIVALPNHELTVYALYSKAELLKKMENYRECVDTYQMLIRRFPKDEITPTCYLKIAEAYCQQSVYEFQNPDILALAELNVRKFKEEFPRDEQIEIAEGYVRRIKELYAKGLCDIGLFYERMSQPAASSIYYQSSIEEFPDTRVADFCRSRLICLGYNEEEEENKASISECLSSEEEALFEELNDQQFPPLQAIDLQEADEPMQEETIIEDSLPMHAAIIEEERPRQTIIIKEDPEEEQAVFLHYSLLKKREAKRACGN